MELFGQLYQRLLAFGVDIARLSLWLIILVAAFIPLERLWALKPQRVFRNGLFTDLGYYFLNSLLPKFLLLLPITLVAWAVHRVHPGSMYVRIAALPIWIRFAAAMIVGEVGSYWGHRWTHEIPLLWRFHKIHHSAEEIDWLVNTRAHPLDLVFTRLCGLIPMYLLGLAQPLGNNVDLVPVFVTLAGTVWGFFIHANLRWRFGWLEFLVSTPAFHHWHHTKDGPQYINRNYAATMPWVDRIFGTFYLPDRWPVKYGVDTPIAQGLAGQLLQPFAGEVTVVARNTAGDSKASGSGLF